MKIRSFYLTLLFAVIALGGASCSYFRSGTLVTYEKGSVPFATVVQEEGTYALLSANDSRPKLTIKLQPGDPIGFKAGPAGQVVAVAGGREIPLYANETYYWKRR